MEKSTFEERETWLRVTLLRRTVQFSGYWCDQCKKKKNIWQFVSAAVSAAS